MGSGTDVTKEAADMILLDDNFSSIVLAVKHGRIVADNLQKSIVYVLTSNAPETAMFVLEVVLNIPGPLSVLLVLVIDVLTDLWPSISLAYEPPEGDVMRRDPRNAYADRLINNKLLAMAYVQVGCIQIAAAITAYLAVFMDYGFWPHNLLGTGVVWLDPREEGIRDSYGRVWSPAARTTLIQLAQTATFMSVVWTQIADLLISRCRRDSLRTRGWTNWQLNSALLIMIVVPPVLMYAPGVRYVLRMQPLPLVHWVPGIAFSLILLFADEIRRHFIRRSSPNSWIQRVTYYQ